MESINRHELSSHIQSATAIFLDTSESIELLSRDGSPCHFLKRFQVGEDEVQLRLDWSDIDGNGNPTLDADFHNIETGKVRKLQGERAAAHHTNATEGCGRNYSWVYSDCIRPFKVEVVWLSSVSFRVGLDVQFEAEVVKTKG